MAARRYWRRAVPVPIDRRMSRRLYRVSRLITAGTCAITMAACAARSDVATGPRPSPFPNAPAWAPAPVASHPVGPVTTAARNVIATALAQQGVPYVYGGDTPQRGFDCSGFVRYVFAQFAVDVPRTAAEQFRVGKSVRKRDLRAGDLVFFTTIAPGASHVGLVIGPDEFVHAPATNGVVRVEPLSSSYWSSRFVGARRVLGD